MRDLALSWYSLLNTLFATLEGPVRAATFGAGGSLLTAVLLGLLGAASPCQLSTNASSIAYLVGGIGRRGRPSDGPRPPTWPEKYWCTALSACSPC